MQDPQNNTSTEYLSSYLLAIVVPLIQSLITGVLIGVTTFVIAHLAGFERGVLPAAIGFLTASSAWLYLINNWQNMLWTLLAPQQQEKRTIDVIVTEQVSHSITVSADIPASESQLIQFATGVFHGTPPSGPSWAGRDATFSRSEFSKFRDNLIRRGWLSWVHPNARSQSIEVTRTGKAVFEYIANNTNHLPTSTE